MPLTKQYRKVFRKDEKTPLAGILALEESISETRENMEFIESLKDLNVCVVRLNPVDYESILKSKEHSLNCVMKAQRCVVVHVLNGHKANVEKWLQKFVERVTDVRVWIIDRIPLPYTNVKRVGHGDSSTVTTAREGNDNSYKMFMEERMQTYKVLKEAVDTMWSGM